MNGVRRVRNWLSERRRFEFCLTTVMVVLLTGTCAALLLLPDSVMAPLRAARPGSTTAPVAGQLPLADARLTEIRRIAEPFGPLVTRQVATGGTQPALVIGHPRQQREVDILADELAAATTAVTDLWGQDWSRAAVVVVSTAPAEFAALVRASTDLPGEIAAATVSDPFTPGAEPTGQRVVFGPDAGRRLDPEGMRALLRHELTHVATRASTVDGSPQWLLEGFAEYAAHRGRDRSFTDIAPTLATKLATGTVPADLPADTEFTGADAATAYELAWSICAYLADTYNDDHLVALYRRLASGPQSPATEDAALREVLGTSRTDLIPAWQSWLRVRPA
ncbi:peptidase MA family metallohydrolase [Nocardia sp. NPDC059180]|uniref:peptidase MA family metallohydrolase n=1 Tax=Nocardia sp. NPDC059180 TaxID=3346761 RepID=UPI00368B30B2